MKCHYEILNIARDAVDDDIKRSYRKLALKNHPDKNPENVEEFTRRFHLIQQAYEVLIDPQERAWYDKHREAILKGGLGKGGDYDDKSLDVYQYFNTACFTGYGDDKEGFYMVYTEVFKTIAAEDLEYLDDQDSDIEIPTFGNSQSSYEEIVGPFYAYWESYCTAKSYVWEEKYDTREAPNRQIRRLMEQDNKKLRDKAKKERNEEVRALVAFVRKRDKRVQAYKKMLEERAVEIARRAQERKKKDRQKRLDDLGDYEETEWSAMSGLEKDLERLEANYAQQFGEETDTPPNEPEEGEEPEEDEEEFFDDLYCVACNKDFKTEKAMENHEKSKKHRENLTFLKAQMEAEEMLASDKGGEDVKETTTDGRTADNGNVSELLEEDLDDLDELSDELDFLEDQPKSKLSKKQKKKRKQQQKLQNLVDNIDDEDPRAQDSPAHLSSHKDAKVISEISPDKILQNSAESALSQHDTPGPPGESALSQHDTPGPPGESAASQQDTSETPGDSVVSQQTTSETPGESVVSEHDTPETPGESNPIEHETSEIPGESIVNQHDTPEIPGEVINQQETQVTPGDEGGCLDKISPGQSSGDCKETVSDQQANDVKASDSSDMKTRVNGNQLKKPKPQIKKEMCNKCGQGFVTRNKLFEHIKKTGHALRVDALPEMADFQETDTSSKGKKKKKGKR